MFKVYTAAKASATSSLKPCTKSKVKHVRIRRGGISIAEFQLIIVTMIFIMSCQISTALLPKSQFMKYSV